MEKFSWYTIEESEGEYTLWLHNRNGLHKPVFTRASLEAVKNERERRKKFNAKVESAIQNAIREIKSNPEALKRLQDNFKTH